MSHEWKHGDVGVRERETGPDAQNFGVFTTQCSRHHQRLGHFHTNGEIGWDTDEHTNTPWRPVLVSDPESNADIVRVWEMAMGTGGPARVTVARIRARINQVLDPPPKVCPQYVTVQGVPQHCIAPMPHGDGGHRIEEVTW